jgi:hypothetical protein
MSRPTEELQELARRAEADFREMVRACEQRWLEELEERRRQLAAECSKLLAPS